jgi:hypothetical protein
VAPLALASHGSAATGDATEWHVGQTWTYRGSLAAPGPPGNVTTTPTVLRVDSTSALLRTEDAWDEFGRFVAETLFSLPEFTIWHRTPPPLAIRGPLRVASLAKSDPWNLFPRKHVQLQARGPPPKDLLGGGA